MKNSNRLFWSVLLIAILGVVFGGVWQAVDDHRRTAEADWAPGQGSSGELTPSPATTTTFVVYREPSVSYIQRPDFEIHPNTSGRAELMVVTVALTVGDAKGDRGSATVWMESGDTVPYGTTQSEASLSLDTPGGAQETQEVVLTALVPAGSTYQLNSEGTGAYRIGQIVNWAVYGL